MVVNFDKDTPEKIVDAIKAENCNITEIPVPFKEDKIIVIANGCAIRLDPRGFDGGWTDATSGRANRIEIFARAVVKDRRLEIITKNLRRPGKYWLLCQNLGQPYIIWFVPSLKFIINSTHSKKITARLHPVRNVRCFSYCKMNSAEELNFFCIIKHSLMAAKLNSRFLRIKKRRLFQNTSKLCFKTKNFQTRAKIGFNTPLITLGASLAIRVQTQLFNFIKEVISEMRK